MSSLRSLAAIAAISALGSALMAPASRREDEFDMLDDIFTHTRRRGFGPRQPPQTAKQTRPALYKASAAPVAPGDGDTRDPKYLHSAAARRRRPTPSETTEPEAKP